MNKRRLLIFALCVALGTVAVAGAEQTTIRMASWGDQWQAQLTENMLRGFKEQYPHINVEYEYHPWGAYWERLQVQLAGGTAPDLMAVNGVYLRPFVEAGAILNLQPFIERDNFPIAEDYFDASGIFVVDGKWYGLPTTGDLTGVYYNEDIFNEVGLALPDWDWTWDDMRSLANRITQRSDNALDRYGVNLNLREDSGGQISWSNYLYQFGTSVFNDDLTEVVLDNEQAVDMVRFISEMVVEDESVFLPGLGVSTLQTFAEGKFAMTVELIPPVIPYFRDNMRSFKWDIMPMPQAAQPASQTNWVGYAAANATEHPEAVWLLLQYLTGPEAQRLIAMEQSAIPSLKDVAFSRDFLLGDLPPHNLGDFLNAVMPNARTLEFAPGYAHWSPQVGKNFFLAFTGIIPPEQAVKQAAEVADRYFRENR